MSPGKVPYYDADRPSTTIQVCSRKHATEFEKTVETYLNTIFDAQDGKRRQLESILKTEKTKEERGKLGCILIDRLIKKFGRLEYHVLPMKYISIINHLLCIAYIHFIAASTLV